MMNYSINVYQDGDILEIATGSGESLNLSHRCQHYRFWVGNPAFRVPSHFSTFQLKCPAFLPISHLSCDVHIICIILCVFPVWNLKQRLHKRKRSPGK